MRDVSNPKSEMTQPLPKDLRQHLYRNHNIWRFAVLRNRPTKKIEILLETWFSNAAIVLNNFLHYLLAAWPFGHFCFDALIYCGFSCTKRRQLLKFKPFSSSFLALWYELSILANTIECWEINKKIIIFIVCCIVYCLLGIYLWSFSA